MRLRFGDFVARVEMAGAEARPAPSSDAKEASPFDFNFEPAEQKEAKARPDTLPEPFGKQSFSFFDEPEDKAPSQPQPIDRDNPFALDLKPATPETHNPSSEGFGDFFGATKAEPEPDEEAVQQRPQAASIPESVVPASSDAALREAFFRGLGLDASEIATDDPVAEMEALGKRFRVLADGVTHLLRTRASEKQKVRIAQTIVGSNNVNPLKFAVSAEESVSALVVPRGSGYLDPDASIDEAFRDLIDHQIRTWSALQTALRRMIDKFDPEAIERELDETGLLETLIAGGQSAKLWQLYQERYEEIARAAEERFLGEVGAEFRDAYEN